VTKTDHEVETIKEGEDRQKDVSEAKNAFAKEAKTEADDAATVQKENEKAWSTLPYNDHDGLQHYPDGRKIFYPDSQTVGGVNNYMEITHRKIKDKEV
jgi:hypothetical protein